MLKYPTSWRFEAPGEGISSVVTNRFQELIFKTAAQDDRWNVVEFFKTYFASAAGVPSGRSSSPSWAESDLDRLMRGASENAPLFVEAFYDACHDLQEQHPDWGVPDVHRVNRILGEAGTGYEIRAPNLVFSGVMAPVAVPERTPSLDEQAQELIQQALKESERLLMEGRHRQAVSEILWLLETVSTAFRGMETEGGAVQEKYFITIARELRRHHKGQVLDQVLAWVTTLYGFLSSPTGGGVRHGADIRNPMDLPKSDAQLYCNLIRSYVTYLMAEHERLSRASNPFL